MKIKSVPIVDEIPKHCKDCIFEKRIYDEDAMWGSGWRFDCNLKYWLGICKSFDGVYLVPCPLDNKKKDHHDGRTSKDYL